MRETQNRGAAPTRRQVLGGLARCGCALAAAAATGCTISRVYDEAGPRVDTMDGRAPFDLADDAFSALLEVGGTAPVDIGAGADLRQLLLIRKSEAEIIALDRICPHLQCDMKSLNEGGVGLWDKSTERLTCLCHNSVFAADGSLVTGPAPTGVGTYAVEFDPATGTGAVVLDAAPETSSMAQSEVELLPLDPETRQAALTLADQPELADVGGMRAVDTGGAALLIIRVADDQFAAVDRVCTHQQCELGPHRGGRYESGGVVCACHGSRFAPDGAVLQGPAERPLTTYPTTYDAANGRVLVEVPEP
ncbi:MAG: Rieske (2Fe-2S) protein [Myxococcales bacterium]|nr:Rieske (2Fe-2S) protein [Myxococcales bacterium]